MSMPKLIMNQPDYHKSGKHDQCQWIYEYHVVHSSSCLCALHNNSTRDIRINFTGPRNR